MAGAAVRSTTASARVHRSLDRATLGGIAVVAAALHAVAIGLGLRLHQGDFSKRQLSSLWQLLPYDVLRHDLFSSLGHLPSQPPAFNLATGLLIELPTGARPLLANTVMLLCAVVLAVATAGVLLELGVPRTVTVVVVGLFVLADPAQYLYVDFYFYALPTAALVTVAAWAAIRWVRSERAVPGACYGACAAALVLTNSTYQLYVVALATIPIAWALRRRWRQVLAVLVVPFVVVGAWYVNDAIRFHTLTTSSWVGMNLGRATVELDAPSDLEALVADHVLAPIVLVRPFSPLGAYGTAGMARATGVAALDQRQKLSALEPNYNNLAYVAISNHYLSNDLHWIEHRPVTYVRNVTVGLRLWLLPTDQYFATEGLGSYRLGGYTTWYDRIVDLQPSMDRNAAWIVVIDHLGPGFANLSYLAVAELLLGLCVLPLVIWRRRRLDPARAAGATWVWATCAIVFVTTTLLEAAENNRFRFELGGAPLIAATVAVVWLVAPSVVGVGLLGGGARGERDGGAGEPLAVDDESPRVPAGGGELQGTEVDGHRDVDG